MAYRSGRSAIGRNNSDSWEDQDAPEADDSRVFLRSSNVNVGVDHLQGLWNSGRGTIVRIEGSRLAFSNGAEAEVAVDHEDETLCIEWQRYTTDPVVPWILVAWAPRCVTWQRVDTEETAQWNRVTKQQVTNRVDSLDRVDFKACLTGAGWCGPHAYTERDLEWDSNDRPGVRQLGPSGGDNGLCPAGDALTSLSTGMRGSSGGCVLQ